MQLPPQIPAAIVQQVKNTNNTPTDNRQSQRLKDEARDALNASIRRATEETKQKK